MREIGDDALIVDDKFGFNIEYFEESHDGCFFYIRLKIEKKFSDDGEDVVHII